MSDPPEDQDGRSRSVCGMRSCCFAWSEQIPHHGLRTASREPLIATHILVHQDIFHRLPAQFMGNSKA